MTHRIAFSLLPLLAFIAFLGHTPTVIAQTDDAVVSHDSDRAAKLATLDSLQHALDALRARSLGEKQPTIETQSQIDALSRRIDELSKKLDSGEVPGAARDADEEEYMTEESFEEDGWPNPEDDASHDEQFTFKPNFYKKYPGIFPWIFPRESRLSETFFRYNRVEGFYFGLSQPKRLYWRSQPRIVATGSLGYGFASHRWRYSLGLFVPFYLENQIIEVGGEGYSFTDTKDQWLVDREENTATALLAREDFMDYFGREGFNVSGSWYYRGGSNLSLRAGLAYVHDTYESLERNAKWSLFGGDKVFREQAPINDGNINSFVVSTGMNTETSLSSSMRGWNVQALAEYAGGVAKGDFDFAQYIVDIRRYQPLADFIDLNLRGRIGASDGDVPVQRVFSLGGISTLPGLRYKELNGTHMALINAELILRSPLADETRGWISQLLGAFNVILFADAGVTNAPTQYLYRESQVPIFASKFSDGFTFDNWKSDLGVAIGSHDGDFRIGLAWRTDRSESPNFILRLSRPF